MKHVLTVLVCLLSVCSFAKAASETPKAAHDSPTPSIDINQVRALLSQPNHAISQDVIHTVEAVIHCANKKSTLHNNTLTVIDYSMPSTEKRLWVFDLKQKTLLYNTYVSHGINSGATDTTFFSNVNKSKTTSLGVFQTKNSYNGRYGLAVRLTGLEKSFNDNAYARALVIHPAWYVSEKFIEKYGRIGRSWGCPAVPYAMIKPIINTIKDQTLLVVYYPSKKWLNKSAFLTCDQLNVAQKIVDIKQLPNSITKQTRDDILFVDKNNNDKHEDGEAVVTMSAHHYQKIFNNKPPLTRMLRRQVNGEEFIALTKSELEELDSNGDNKLTLENEKAYEFITLMAAKVKKVRWFWATEFTPLKHDKQQPLDLTESTVQLGPKNKDITIKSTGQFIRWLGL